MCFSGPAILPTAPRRRDYSIGASHAIRIRCSPGPPSKRCEELRGKKDASAPRAVPHLRFIDPDKFAIKDATILQMGGQPEAAAGLRKGSSTVPCFGATIVSTDHRGISLVIVTRSTQRLGSLLPRRASARAGPFAAKSPGTDGAIDQRHMEGVTTIGEREPAKKVLAKHRQRDAEADLTISNLRNRCPRSDLVERFRCFDNAVMADPPRARALRSTHPR